MNINDKGSKGKCRVFHEDSQKQDKGESIPLIGQLNGETMMQAVVMSELLGKPKAKRRRRGR